MAKNETTKSFVLRLNAATMAAVEKWAADEFRSTNGQLQWIVTEALRKNRRLPKKHSASMKNENEQQDSAKESAQEE